MTMTRSDLVQELTNHFYQLNPYDVESSVKMILNSMSQALANAHRIEIRGFGSFNVTERAPRLGRNPRTGETVAIPSKRAIHFKAGKTLRGLVDQAVQAQIQQVQQSILQSPDSSQKLPETVVSDPKPAKSMER